MQVGSHTFLLYKIKEGQLLTDFLYTSLIALGKTTTTERMLHYAGVTRKIGGQRITDTCYCSIPNISSKPVFFLSI